MNTNTAGLARAVIVGIINYFQYKKLDITMVLNGALGGLVAITAGADLFDIYSPIWIGVIGGILVVIFVPIFDKLKLDDPVGALSVHLVNGIWGTLAVGIFSDTSFWAQLKGVIIVAIFAFVVSYAVISLINRLIPIAANSDDQLEGLHTVECGMESYPEFKSNT